MSSKSIAFGYDASGNQTSKTIGGVSTNYVYDSRNKLVEAQLGQDSFARFQYDFDGQPQQEDR